MSDDKNILGCYVSATQASPDADQVVKDLAMEQGRLFRNYIWGDNGICDILKKLNHEDYGSDLKLVLFQFYVNPIPMMEQALKEIEAYRKNEKSIGIPIVVNQNNFFSKSEEGRYSFLKQSILQKLDLLMEVVKKKKLDTKVDLLKVDLQKLLS
ncbi:hypothetical protein [Albibacterium sp.]|uniref:hypothetical protein n=1 Tax=Albibacterium sp. TaxID=2952885 RepID=UPI002B66E142|nr:hypothetical protein [Albibacterium sp.]HUH17863.1 hypothetical protein [Albibacterium sp.]